MTRDPALARAYREAIYRVETPRGPLDLAIDRLAPELDRLLEAAGARCWAYVTAANPGSIRLDDRANERRVLRLDLEIARRGWRALAGASLDPTGAWPPEPSRLVLDVAEDDARDLAHRFGQKAFVAGVLGAPARLCWVDAGDADAGDADAAR